MHSLLVLDRLVLEAQPRAELCPAWGHQDCAHASCKQHGFVDFLVWLPMELSYVAVLSLSDGTERVNMPCRVACDVL